MCVEVYFSKIEVNCLSKVDNFGERLIGGGERLLPQVNRLINLKKW